MLKHEIKEIFLAGKRSNEIGYTFEQWYLDNTVDEDRIVHVYKSCFREILGIDSSEGLNRRLAPLVHLKHIIRYSLIKNINALTYETLGKIEKQAGKNSETDHSTISHSIKTFEEQEFRNNWIRRVNKIITELYYDE